MRHVHADLIHAWADGSEIQFKYKCGGIWLDFKTTDHTWHPDVEYRIKPKTVKKWQWAFKNNENNWCVTCDYLSEKEIEYRGTFNRYVKLDFTEIEVQE